MNTPKYPARLAESVAALELLALHRRGMAIDDLADLLGIDAHQLRGNLASYRDGMDVVSDRFHDTVLFLDQRPPDSLADTRWVLGPGDHESARTAEQQRREQWEDDHQSAEIASAVWVVLRRMPADRVDPFGVMLGIAEIAEIITVAESLAELEPDNEPLRRALTELRSRWFPDQTASSVRRTRSAVLPVLKRAEQQQLRVRVSYVDEWTQETTRRVIEPLQLRRRASGYEVDVGPVRPDGTISTLLVDNISDPRLLAKRFERPRNAEDLIAAGQRTRAVTLYVPKSAPDGWDLLADSGRVLAEDPGPDGDRHLRLELREPVAERLGRLLLQAGPGAVVDEPAELEDAGAELARRLLRQHGLV